MCVNTNLSNTLRYTLSLIQDETECNKNTNPCKAESTKAFNSKGW